MAFKLRITFSGLCLFVVEPAAGRQQARMHVLMPNAVLSHLHIPVLEFDPVHLVETATDPTKDFLTQFLLRKFALPIDGPDLNTNICPSILPLRDVTEGPVISGLFTGNPNTLLASRVTLLGGKMSRVDPGVCWTWVDGARRQMAHVAEWEVILPGDRVQLRLTDLNGGTFGVPDLPVLFAKDFAGDGNLLLNVSVRHLPPEELPFEQYPVKIPTQAPHVAMYYPLFEGNPATLLPTDPREEDPRCPPAETCDVIDEAGESAFNCMLGAG
jgi:hypothetical protein